MTENEFILSDRIAKIQSINAMYDLENNAYVSFSGGKDSTVLHYLIDEALPGNNIPRVFINTGIEYKLILQFVRDMAAKDNRIQIINAGKNIKRTLETEGYPFKSKEHSHKLQSYKNGCRSPSIMRYFEPTDKSFNPCPSVLLYQIKPDFKLNISDRCCYNFKKKPAADYSKKTGRNITITGMMKEEGGQRTTLFCIVTDKDGSVKKFHPMAVVSKEFEDWYISHKSIQLCLQCCRVRAANTSRPREVIRRIVKGAQLNTLGILLPSERKRAEWLWAPIYAEYRRIGYRLDKTNNQPSLFEEFN